MSKQYAKILAVMQAANGPVTASEIKAIDGIVASRLSTYLWEIRKHTGCAIKANRDGRTVVSYELVGEAVMPAAKPAKAAKAPVAKAPAKAKVATKTKAVKVKQDPIPEIRDTAPMATAGIVDVFDAIDDTVESFEDREFAEDFVRNL
jgi:hypothetical protein